MKQTCIYDLATFRVYSYGNGASYLFQNKTTEMEIMFQGEDACQFENDFNKATNTIPDFDAAFGIIWEYYEELAEPWN